MIYLLNNTDPQEIYIPKNTSGVNPHKSNSYWEGFEDGYESGETHQKNLLSSVTFTENGEYERENGWSAVTVDVPQTGSTARLEEKTVVISADTTNVTPSSGYDGMSAVTVDASSYAQENYDDGFDDGFTDGYASGSTDEKAKLSAVTFTTNTAVTISDGGYSAITVNVPQTGSSLNVEANKPYTAATNGNYTITPSSGQTNMIKGYEDGVDFYFTASTYPSVGYFEIGTIELYDRDDEPIGSVDIYYNNGQIGYDDSDWDESIYTGVTGNTMLYIGFDEDDYSDYVWRNGEDFSFNYDVMSAVSLNVNVDTASTYNSGYTSGYTDGQDNIIGTFSAMTATTNGQYGSSAHPMTAITVNVPQTGGSSTLGIGSFSGNGTYSASTDNLDGYSAITINVPQTGANITDTIVYVTANTQAVSASHHNVDGFGNVLIRAEYWWQSGYTSGFTDGTGALSAITFTANTAVTLNQGGYSAVTVNIDTATTWNEGYAAGQGELFCLYCENALFNIGENSSQADFDLVGLDVLPLSDFKLSVGGGNAHGDLTGTESGNTINFVGHWYWTTSDYHSAATVVGSTTKGTIPTGMTSVAIDAMSNPKFYVGYSSASTQGVSIQSGPYGITFSGSSFYISNIKLNDYWTCFSPYVDDNGNACMIGPNSTLVYPTSGTCYAVYKKVTKNGEYVYYMNKEVGRVTQ